MSSPSPECLRPMEWLSVPSRTYSTAHVVSWSMRDYRHISGAMPPRVTVCSETRGSSRDTRQLLRVRSLITVTTRAGRDTLGTADFLPYRVCDAREFFMRMGISRRTHGRYDMRRNSLGDEFRLVAGCTSSLRLPSIRSMRRAREHDSAFSWDTGCPQVAGGTGSIW